ncbi:MAG: 2-phospho-L-lactate transferase CofD family protein, partial [Vicinamibacterales bacterium]
MPTTPPRRSRMRVVLFSGGRGSGALAAPLASNPRVDLTIAINGYDDGASTGEVRRFLGDSLGPSDFRKNASRLARLLSTGPAALIDLLDLRLPDTLTGRSVAGDLSSTVDGAAVGDPRLGQLGALSASLPEQARANVSARLGRFATELEVRGAPFSFADCSVGNLVFAGAFLMSGRDFNATVDDYCHLLGLPAGFIENVTDGTDAFLVAIDADGRLLGSEEEIVDAKRSNRIQDIFLLSSRPTASDLESLAALHRDVLASQLSARAADVRINPRLSSVVTQADLIVYAPGTQHSSLFPSYLTPGLSDAIAANLTAIKLLVTNIQADAEISGSSAVDIIERAVYYLKEKGRLAVPTPCLITHYLLNDPRQVESETPYVPLGRLESLEDPRLVRVGNYEEGVTGRHDAAKILGPFVESFIARWEATERVAILLHEADSITKVVQTILEMIRGGIRELPVDLAVFHDGPAVLEPSFVTSVGFPVTRLEGTPVERDAQFRAAVEQAGFDYVVMFESSGMYNGEDVANLASHLSLGRLDAVWGSRRLSVKDIHESYRLKYRHRTTLGAVSYLGSHVLSLAYLALYGRYVSDTLSGARVVRAADVLRLPGLLTDKLANQRLLSVLLRRKAEMFEVPV